MYLHVAAMMLLAKVLLATNAIGCVHFKVGKSLSTLTTSVPEKKCPSQMFRYDSIYKYNYKPNLLTKKKQQQNEK